MSTRSSEPESHPPQKMPPIFCSQAGVGVLIGVALAVSLIFSLFGSSLLPAISKAFDATVRYSNNVSDKH